jgi:hypothetical protein
MTEIKTSRLKKIELLAEQVASSNHTNHEQQTNNIYSKYKKQLKLFRYRNSMTDLRRGSILAYVTLDLNTLKKGIIVKIKDDYIYLKDIQKDQIWKIKGRKYYLFEKPNQSEKQKQLMSILDNYYDIVKIMNKTK